MTILNRAIRNLTICAAAVVAGCGGDANEITGHPTEDPGSPGGPSGDPGAPRLATPDMRVAITENAGPAHVLFVGRLDGALRNQLHFTGVSDSIPGNLPALPVRDDKLINIAAPSLSPDGAKLAVVVTVGPRQSEIVVMNADGTGAQVASNNLQIVTSIPAWSSDGAKLAYAMSTQLDTAGVDLFVTDLKTHTVTRLTTNAEAKATAMRWSADGASIYYARRGGTSTDGLNNVISELIKVDVATGVRHTVLAPILGDVASIAPSASRVLLTRSVAAPGGGTTVSLIELALGAQERVVVASDAVSARYVSGGDDLAVVVSNVSIGGHTSTETAVMNLQTRAALSVVGADAASSIDAFHPGTR